MGIAYGRLFHQIGPLLFIQRRNSERGYIGGAPLVSRTKIPPPVPCGPHHRCQRAGTWLWGRCGQGRPPAYGREGHLAGAVDRQRGPDPCSAPRRGAPPPMGTRCSGMMGTRWPKALQRPAGAPAARPQSQGCAPIRWQYFGVLYGIIHSQRSALHSIGFRYIDTYIGTSVLAAHSDLFFFVYVFVRLNKAFPKGRPPPFSFGTGLGRGPPPPALGLRSA